MQTTYSNCLQSFLWCPYPSSVCVCVCVCLSQIDEEVAKLLQLKAQLGGDDGKHQFVLKTAKVRLQC